MTLAMHPEGFKLLPLMLLASHVAEVVVMFALVLEGAERDGARDVSTRPTSVRCASPEVDLSTFNGTILKDVSASAI